MPPISASLGLAEPKAGAAPLGKGDLAENGWGVADLEVSDEAVAAASSAGLGAAAASGATAGVESVAGFGAKRDPGF